MCVYVHASLIHWLSLTLFSLFVARLMYLWTSHTTSVSLLFMVVCCGQMLLTFVVFFLCHVHSYINLEIPEIRRSKFQGCIVVHWYTRIQYCFVTYNLLLRWLFLEKMALCHCLNFCIYIILIYLAFDILGCYCFLSVIAYSLIFVSVSYCCNEILWWPLISSTLKTS